MSRTPQRRLTSPVSVAVAILTALTGCSGSHGKHAAAGPATPLPVSSSQLPQNADATVPGAPTPSASTPAAQDTASASPASGADGKPTGASPHQGADTAPSKPTSKPSKPAGGPGTSIGDAVLLQASDLPSWSRTPWTQDPDRTKASGPLLDPDHCDPGAQLPGGGSPYPAASNVVNALTKTWILPTTYALTSETVITYPSADAAAADLRMHQSWLAACTTAFTWTEMPHAQTVTPVSLPMANAFAFRAAMYAPGQPASAAGTQGYAYTAVVQRGNALAVLVTTSDSGAVSASPNDPGAGWITDTADRLATRLAATYR